ncbi:MAG: hypothetical protein AB7P00_30745, partial [Sandaracinaceae bacterium]
PQGDPARGGTALGRPTTMTNTDRGRSAGVCSDWVGAPTTATEVWIQVDSGDMARECIEDNNVVDLGEARCNSIE